MDINKKLISYNFVKGRKEKIKYIVIHDTGNKNLGANADAHYRYFNSGYVGQSAHYFVDQNEVIQIIEDNDTAWAVGDGKGKYGVTNNNSLSIEICVNDGDYTREVQLTIELTAYLMKKHNIDINHVIRHYDASKKNCPAFMSKNNWEAWGAFKVMLQRELDKASNTNKIKVNIKSKTYEMEGIFQNDKNYVGVRELAETLGFKVDWNQATKTVVIK